MIQRNTPQRVLILDAFEKLKHAELADIINYLRENNAKVSLATIYRNIDALLSSGLIKSFSVNGKIYYEKVSKKKHAYFYCRKCQKITNIDLNDNFAFMKYTPSKVENNMVYNYDLILQGVCHKCLKKD